MKKLRESGRNIVTLLDWTMMLASGMVLQMGRRGTAELARARRKLSAEAIAR